MKLRHLFCVFLIIQLFAFSCTPYKNVPYFQDLKRDSVVTEQINNFTPLTIQTGDLLALHVTSMNREADAIFNYNLERPGGVNAVTSTVTEGIPSENVVYGYLVDSEGNIHVPVIGEVKAAGLTTEQLTTDIEAKLATTLTNPVVDIRIQNFKISILGDVKTPGTFIISEQKITVTGALALAGDLNTTGMRNNVLIIREVDGKRKYITFDLTSKNIFNSPYYYLKNNDVIYVQPNKEKVADNGNVFQKASIALAVLSIIVYLIKK